MDPVSKYKKIIRDVMAEYAEFLNGPPEPKFEVALALDDDHGQYMLRRVGWSDKERYKLYRSTPDATQWENMD